MKYIKLYEEINENHFTNSISNLFKHEHNEIALNILNDLKKDYENSDLEEVDFTYDIDGGKESYEYVMDGLVVTYEIIRDDSIENDIDVTKELMIDGEVMDISYLTRIKFSKFFNKIKREIDKKEKNMRLKNFKERIKPENITSRKYNL